MRVQAAYEILSRRGDGGLVPAPLVPIDLARGDLRPATAVACAVLSGVLPACETEDDLYAAVRSGLRDFNAGLASFQSGPWSCSFLAQVAVAVHDEVVGVPVWRYVENDEL